MQQDEFFKIVGIIIVCFFIIYVVVNMFHLQTQVIEGLTADSISDAIAASSGEAGTSSSYAAAIKSQVIKLQDELLVSKYRKDYEAAIINLDDYIGLSMLKMTLNLKMNDDIKTNIDVLDKLNILKNAKDSLNSTMAFLDKQ